MILKELQLIVEVRAMKKSICVTLFLGLYFGAVFCDQNCDNAMNGKVENYANGVSSSDLIVCSDLTQVGCGKEYAPALLEKIPTLYYDVQEQCKWVTVMFFGTDEDSKTKLLWLVYNVPVSDLKNGFHGQSGNETISYRMPQGSSSTTDHFFFVYCQGSNIIQFNCCTYNDREDTNVKDLSEKNNLKSVSAAMYFMVTATDQLMDDKPDKGGICDRTYSEE